MPYVDTATITFGDTPVDVSCDVLGATATPNTNVSTRKTMCGSKSTAPLPDWTLDVDYDQNWATEGMSDWVQANVGTEQAFSFTSDGLDKVCSGTFLVIAGPFGGTAGEDATGTVSFPIIGQPTFSDPA